MMRSRSGVEIATVKAIIIAIHHTVHMCRGCIHVVHFVSFHWLRTGASARDGRRLLELSTIRTSLSSSYGEHKTDMLCVFLSFSK